MQPINPLLLLDYYKTTHHEQYPKGLTRLVSYFTPRISRLPGENEVVFFGLQAFLKTYLQDYMQKNFFDLPLEEVMQSYSRVLDNTLGEDAYDKQKIADLHNLGYLPLRIRAIAEGSWVPMQVPCIEIANTHPDFAWLVNTIESLMSAEMWHPMVSATVGALYRDIVDKAYNISVDDDTPHARALSDFSFRGQESLQSAMKSSAGFCLSFLNTATVPAINFLEQNYFCDCRNEDVAFGLISTEHSVMCSNYAIDGNEFDFVRRLLTEIYPNHSFAMVSDSYDYWNMVDEILPLLKSEILSHNGTLFVRGDSGDPVDIVTQTVPRLWKTFGGTVNAKGYRVLDSHIRVSYGDSITLTRAREIYRRLIADGFAANNVSLGVGSFSMQCMEGTDGTLYPFTRDTFGIAVKSTYGEVGDRKFPIFKSPKTDTGHFKKSQYGMCRVFQSDSGKLTYEDGYDFDHADEDRNLLQTAFENGTLYNVQSLSDVRNMLHNGEF